MKQMLLLLICATLSTSAFGQDFAPRSLLADATDELRVTAYDEVTGVFASPDALEYERRLLFTGLTNVAVAPAGRGSVPSVALDSPLYAGFFARGQSLLARGYGRSASADATPTVGYVTAAPVPVTEDGVTTNYTWYDQITEDVPTAVVAARRRAGAQWLRRVNDGIVGTVGFALDLIAARGINPALDPAFTTVQDYADDYSGRNRRLVTNYYENTAAAGSVPTAELDYSRTATTEQRFSRTDVSLSIPLTLSLLERPVALEPGVSLHARDDSSTETLVTTAPRYTAATVTDTLEDRDTARYGEIAGRLRGRSWIAETEALSAPAALRVDVAADFTLPYNRGLGSSTVTQEYIYPGNGEAGTPGQRAETRLEAATNPRVSGGIDVASRLTLTPIETDRLAFAVGPEVGVGYALSPNAPFALQSLTNMTSEELAGTGNGTFTDATDTTTTVTREFTTGRLDPETKGIVDEVDNHTFTVEVATPAAFSVVPFTPRTGAGFVPSIVFVAIPEITFAATRVVTRAAVARETTTVVQGDGTVTSRTVDQPGPSVTSHVWGLETTTSLRHHLVVRLESESATIDISLNGSSILDWDDLSIQAVIPY